MENKSMSQLAIIPVVILTGLFIACLVITQNFNAFQIVSIHSSFTLVHKITGAIIAAAGISLLLSHYTGIFPSTPFGRSLLLLFVGLAIFSMSPLFGVSAAIMYAVDGLRPYLKPVEKGADL